ncbi:MAG: FtsX-like permease family protein, partial [Microbacterium sp.]
MSTAATVAIAVATVCLVLALLDASVATAGRPAPPGVAPDDLADQIEAGASALTSAAPALVLLVAIIAGTAVAQLARLVAAAREHETATLRARGLSRRQAWAVGAAEGVVVSLLGSVAGVAVSTAALVVTPASVPARWPWILATFVVLAAVYAIALRRGERGATTTRAGRATTVALLVVVLLAAALVLWQLPHARGTGFDPIVAIAPAVLLMTGAIIALAAFGTLAAAWSRPAAAFPGLQPGYPARQVARRTPIYAVAVLLVALSVAQAVFASAYASTWQAMSSDSAAVRAGADLRVDMSPQATRPVDVATAAGVEGVDRAAPVLVGEVEIGGADAQLVAVPADAVGSVVAAAGGLIDKDALAAAGSTAGTVTAGPLPLGDAATGLRVTARAEFAARSRPDVALSALLIDANGAPARVLLDQSSRADDGQVASIVAEAPLPEGSAPWSLLAVTADRGRIFTGDTLRLSLESAEAVGVGSLGIAAETELGIGETDVVVWLADDGAFAAGTEPAPVAAVVSETLAARLGVAEGDVFEFRYARSGREGQAVVSSVTGVVPGASLPLAFFTPSDALLVSQLQRGTSIVPPNSVWAAGSLSAAEPLSAALGDRIVLTTAPGVAAQVVGALIPGWWIATAGAMAMSLMAAFGIVQTLA